MSRKYYLGSLRVDEQIDDIVRHYETAAWWTSYEVQPGIYNVWGYRYCATGAHIWQPVWDAEGTITGEHLGSPRDGEKVGHKEVCPLKCRGGLPLAVVEERMELTPWAFVDQIPTMKGEGDDKRHGKGRAAIFLKPDAPWYSLYHHSGMRGTEMNPDHPPLLV